MIEGINFNDIEFGEPIEEREPTYRDGYIRGIYRTINIAKNIIDSKQREIERLQRQKEELQVNGLRQETLFKLEIERLNNIINEFDRYIDEIIDERIEKIEGTRFLKGGFTIEQNYLRRRLHERLQELKGVDK